MFIGFSHEEIKVVLNALDFYSRIHMGQYDEIISYLVAMRDLRSKALLQEIESDLSQMRDILIPELSRLGMNSSYGIYSNKINKKAATAYNLLQVFRRTVAYYYHPEGGRTVEFRDIFRASRDPYPLAKVHLCWNFCEEDFFEFYIQIQQWQLIKTSLRIYRLLMNGNLSGLFFYYTRNKEALKIAERITDRIEDLNFPSETKATIKMISSILSRYGVY